MKILVQLNALLWEVTHFNRRPPSEQSTFVYIKVSGVISEKRLFDLDFRGCLHEAGLNSDQPDLSSDVLFFL